MAKIKPLSKVLSVTIFCAKCGKQTDYSIDQLYFKGYEGECELCGSHGSVDVEFTCTCGFRDTIELRSW